MNQISRVVIVGGGTAGWMAAAGLSKSLGRNIEIRLIESDEIGTVGVGEAVIPLIKSFHTLLELDEAEFLRAVNGTIKLGIEFENWGRLGESYFHPFGNPGVETWAAQFHHYWLRARRMGETGSLERFSPEASMAHAGKFTLQTEPQLNYAYHFDAALYAAMLRKLSESWGVSRTEGKVVNVKTNGESGHIESVQLESGQRVEGDLFVDCTGFRGLLIEQELQAGWEDWSHWLRNNRAVAVQSELVAPPLPYTRSIARSAGWQWKIPLQNRMGNGMVYCSDYISDDEAQRALLDNVEGNTLTDVRTIRFGTGRRSEQWVKNCVAVGLSSGFLEPLESTSIHLIQNSVLRLVRLFPAAGIEPAEVRQFNDETATEIEQIRDFIILHYKVTERRDSPYWVDCSEMSIPDHLAHKIELFRSNARAFRDNTEMFLERSWAAVMLGQGVEPAGYHPFVDNLTDDQLRGLMDQVKNKIAGVVVKSPSHRDFLQQYCAPQSS
ncbi:MAG: tryptophan 7-halogenase [Xanthomonadales bacterium]|nr:tryptophan 7-halogenase [Gammaproteobacteria bacterium]MBT8054439.1 tryptophan 7-halogenase [Gammaproteobacteria bacterium]NND58453.1 tryptophan 7-halogenase [Xanthomonadales bacterium]NNK50126.1 tryptophan 7-halogenase [Xanthomonadales bacterium]